ncbi:MAG: helix-hairpin-helix domain-containing protein [Chloroflexota bacterium]
MTTGSQKLGGVIIICLALVIVAGGVFIVARYAPPPPLEISLSPPPPLSGEIYVSGNVSRPGFYPLNGEDTLPELLQAAGGTADTTAPPRYYLYVGERPAEAPQRVNINTAESWLLEALPGIGETRAGAIIRYREDNGGFRSTAEIMQVDGIGTDTYERIRDLITVAE